MQINIASKLLMTIGLLLASIIFFQTSNLKAEENSESFSKIILKGVIDRPIYSFVERTSLSDNSSQISKIGIGFDGEIYVNEANGMDYAHRKQFIRLQFLTLSGVYKQYENISDNSVWYTNFNLFKFHFLDETFGGFVIGINANIFELKTTWYSNNNIDWAKVGLSFGYDFMSSHKDLIIAPTLNANVGIETLKADTLTCLNLQKAEQSDKLQFLEASINLKVAYKSLSLDMYSRFNGGNDLMISTKGGKLAFTLWNDRNPEKSKTSKSNYSINVMKIFVSYNFEDFDVLDDNSDSIYNIGHTMYRAGISAKLGKIEFFDE